VLGDAVEFYRSTTHAFTVAVFGATTQIVVTWLIGAAGALLSPAYHAIAINVITLITMFTVPGTGRRELAE